MFLEYVGEFFNFLIETKKSAINFVCPIKYRSDKAKFIRNRREMINNYKL